MMRRLVPMVEDQETEIGAWEDLPAHPAVRVVLDFMLLAVLFGTVDAVLVNKLDVIYSFVLLETHNRRRIQTYN